MRSTRVRTFARAVARAAALALATMPAGAPVFGQAPDVARAEGASPRVEEAAEAPLREAREDTPRPRPRPFVELAAGPLLGLDKPLRGAAADALAGIKLSPFEAGARAACAYDSELKAWDARFDLVLGLGAGLRAIVGGLLLSGGPTLSDSSGREAAVRATAADWPNRFGVGARIADLFPRSRGGPRLGSRRPALGLDAELVYTSYRVEADDALSGAAAFAAGVELRLALSLGWRERRLRP